MKKVDVIILSGFLGSGKTTLLQKMLKQEQEAGRKTAVVMNEVGEVSIDSDSVPEETPLKELLNGCICCTLSGKLEIKLSELLHGHELDVIYIETTGVAHPVEVLDTCLSPMLAEKLRIRSIITLLDVMSWKERHSLSIPVRQLITEQVKHADIVVMNKIDCIRDDARRAVEEEVRSLNPKGAVVPTTFADVDLNELIQNERQQSGDHVKIHADGHLHIKTFVHSFQNPVSQQLFEDFLRSMPDSIYRIKGYLRFDEKKETLFFQYSYGMTSYEKADLKMKNTLVFIGDEMDHEELSRTLMEIEKKGTA
ncbi:CobW family GTP-binding protein [Alkalicoccus saliphilus]|uniref:Cobalamin biosynthesis protein n=1 Tax=Alkalicoccus saliphilus TaxID=200989 RepID=A0A2T4U474_9BACI|nr:GTP-binding protein [Alkalicoccus saliphilus]PTL38194.1 cobalamin biosynthesis protein [Alkalicoccus saliphilus]